jgi:hypothetical protein
MNSPEFFTVTSFEDRTVAEIVYKGAAMPLNLSFHPRNHPQRLSGARKKPKRIRKPNFLLGLVALPSNQLESVSF